MGQRRMFSKRITDSAKFLRMPISSQALYFHLGLHADDDGVVEAFPVLKTTGCTEDDLRVLVAKEFVTVLNDDLVSYINDWNENNLIRPDRKTDSIYKELLLSTNPAVKFIEKRPRSDVKNVQDRTWTDNGQDMDSPRTDNGRPKLSKDKLSQDKLSKGNTGRFTPPTLDEVKQYIHEQGYSVDAERFMDFYESKGWMVGKNKMKDWKAAVRTWQKSGKESTRDKVNNFSTAREEDDMEEWVHNSMERLYKEYG